MVKLLCFVKILDMVGMNVPQEYESLDMVRVVLEQLGERLNSILRSAHLCQKKGKVEQGNQSITKESREQRRTRTEGR